MNNEKEWINCSEEEPPSNLELLYDELLEREKILEQGPTSDVINGRIAELSLVILRIQQLLLKDIGNELESRETTEG